MRLAEHTPSRTPHIFPYHHSNVYYNGPTPLSHNMLAQHGLCDQNLSNPTLQSTRHMASSNSLLAFGPAKATTRNHKRLLNNIPPSSCLAPASQPRFIEFAVGNCSHTFPYGKNHDPLVTSTIPYLHLAPYDFDHLIRRLQHHALLMNDTSTFSADSTALGGHPSRTGSPAVLKS